MCRKNSGNDFEAGLTGSRFKGTLIFSTMRQMIGRKSMRKEQRLALLVAAGDRKNQKVRHPPLPLILTRKGSYVTYRKLNIRRFEL